MKSARKQIEVLLIQSWISNSDIRSKKLMTLRDVAVQIRAGSRGLGKGFFMRNSSPC